MARGERSYVRRRRRGCLSGCLIKLLLLLGLLSLLLVGACVLGFVKTDPDTGAPVLSLQDVDLSGVDLSALPKVDLPQVDLDGLSLPGRVMAKGLSVKTLRAGKGEAVLVCCNGRTMLLGGGENGLLTYAQMLLSGVNRLDVAVMTDTRKEYAGGLAKAIEACKPAYLLCPTSQTKTDACLAAVEAARGAGAQVLEPRQGQPFDLGGALVTLVGPSGKPHLDERDDGLSVRIDYGSTSVLLLGAITATGEAELVTSPANLDADALVCAGTEETASARLVQAVKPAYALLTAKSPSNDVRMRLDRAGATVYAARENGAMMLVSDGTKLEVRP